jgi:Malectin domain/Domain of unknown function (DUF1929)/Glyoxal oxidase N-terminus/Bacterial Ig-like domain (group 1)
MTQQVDTSSPQNLAASSTITIVSGDGQTGTVGTTLSSPLVVLVKNSSGNPQSGVTVTFTVTGGGGTLSAGNAVTNASGQASTTLTLGKAALQNSVRATAANIGSVTFTANATPGAPKRVSMFPAGSSTSLNTAVTYVATLVDSNNNVVKTTPNPIKFSFIATGISGTFNPSASISTTNGKASVSFTPSSIGTGTVIASATNINNVQPTDPPTNPVFSSDLTVPAPQLININSGGGNYTDVSGKLWYTDFGFSSGQAVTNNNSITGTSNPTLYHSARVGSSFSYSIPVSNGTYTLKLHFAETEFSSAGQRIFNVSAQGQQILTNFDIFVAAGNAANKAFTPNSSQVTVTNGTLNLVFTGVVSNALVSCIDFTLSNAPSDASVNGTWEVLPYESQVLPVHAALLHTNRVLFFSGSATDPNAVGCPNCSAVWNFQNNTIEVPHPQTPLDTQGNPIDFFCAGHAFLSDGRLLVTGGTLLYKPYRGRTEALIFDPSSEQWTQVQSMAGGRWYPTQTTLGDGRVLAMSGLGTTSSFNNVPYNQVPEIYTDPTGWSALPKTSKIWPLYPHLFLLMDGRIFFSGGKFASNDFPDGNLPPTLLNLTTNATATVGVVEATRNQSASVLLPPAQNQKVMIIGGGPNDGASGNATSSVKIVELKSASPAYVSTGSLHNARMHHNAVLLPDRTVLVCGGSLMRENEMKATLVAEIYDPTTGKWTPAAQASIPRLYHSVALLLPDGRVITAGSNPTPKVEELRLEVYRPPYLFKGTRPVITSTAPPQAVTYGGTIQISTAQAANIQWVSLIAAGVTTHSFNMAQRLVDMPINSNSRTSNSLTVAVTDERNIAPPGWYMLFITDNNGVPSVATWIHLT